MARETQQRQKPQSDPFQRQLRRNQLIMAGFSILLILSMVISLIRW